MDWPNKSLRREGLSTVFLFFAIALAIGVLAKLYGSPGPDLTWGESLVPSRTTAQTGLALALNTLLSPVGNVSILLLGCLVLAFGLRRPLTRAGLRLPWQRWLGVLGNMKTRDRTSPAALLRDPCIDRGNRKRHVSQRSLSCRSSPLTFVLDGQQAGTILNLVFGFLFAGLFLVSYQSDRRRLRNGVLLVAATWFALQAILEFLISLNSWFE